MLGWNRAELVLRCMLNRGRRETDRRDARGLPMQTSSAFPTISSVCPFANTKHPSSSVITIGTSAISTTSLRASSEESCGESFICLPTPTGGSAPLIGTALHQYKRDSQPFVPFSIPFPTPHFSLRKEPPPPFAQEGIHPFCRAVIPFSYGRMPRSWRTACPGRTALKYARSSPMPRP